MYLLLLLPSLTNDQELEACEGEIKLLHIRLTLSLLDRSGIQLLL